MADSSILECFDNPNPGRDYMIEHSADQFTSLCPKTGHPDFATVIVRYIPQRLCVELKSLKFYLQSYRDEGIYYEAVTNRIADDLSKFMKPKWILVETQWAGRGGIQSTIRVEMGRVPREYAEDFDDEQPLERPSDEDRAPPGY